MEYNYPGNIRELENILEHGFVRCQGNTILIEHLPKDIFKTTERMPEVVFGESDNPLMILEREFILKILIQHNWRQGEVAKRLKMSRATLWRKIKQLKIEKEEVLH